jgi:hypothetical protein
MNNAHAEPHKPLPLREIAIPGLLGYRAPFLIEKLVKNHIADNEEEARALLLEVKKCLLITWLDTEINWKMYSVRVDEAWHQFILYTDASADFCEHLFGKFMGHSPVTSCNRTKRVVQIISSRSKAFSAAMKNFL